MADGKVIIEAILNTANVKKNLGELKSSINNVSWDNIKNGDEKAQQLAESFKTAGTACTLSLTTPIVAAGAAAFNVAKDYEGATSRIQAALGVTREEAEKFKNIGAEVYEGGWGESLEDVTDALLIAKENFRDLDETSLQGVTESALMLADVFDMDVRETLRGAENLATGFGISAENAMDLMTKAAQNGLNSTDELGDNLAEYATLFQESGYSADEMFAILQAGLEGGAYNLDKVNDLVKEFGIRVADGSIKTACDELGGNFKKVYTEASKSGKSNKEIFQLLTAEVGKCKTEQEKAAAISAIFGSMGEDAGIKVIEAMGNVENAYKDVEGAAEQAKQEAGDNFANKMESATRTIMGSLEPLGEPLLELASEAADLIKEFGEWFSSMDSGGRHTVLMIAGVVAAIGPALTITGKLVTATSTVHKMFSRMGAVVTKYVTATKSATTANTGLSRSQLVLNAGLSKGRALASTFGAALKAALPVLIISAAVAIVAKLVEAIAQADQRARDFEASTKGLDDAAAGLNVTLDEEAEALDGVADSAGKTKLDDIIQQHKDLAKSITENKQEALNSVAVLSGYGDTIQELAGRTNLSEEELAKLKLAVEGANDEMGTSYTVAKDASGAYQVMADGAVVAKDKIQELIEAQKVQIQLEAAKENYKNAYQQLQNDTQAYTDAVANQTAKQEAFNAKIAELGDQRYTTNLMTGETIDLAQAEADALDEANSKVAEMEAQMGASQSAVNKLTEQQTLLQMALQDGASDFIKAAANNQTFQSSVQSVGVDLVGFTQALEEMGYTTEDLANMTPERVMELARSWRDGTGEMAESVEDMNSKLPKDMKSGLNKASAATKQAIGGIKGIFSSFASDAGGLGQDAGENYGEGIEQGNAGKNAQSLEDKVKGILSTNDAYTWGLHTGQNYAKGLKASKDILTDTSNLVAGVVADILKHTVPKEGPLRNGGKGEVEWGEHTIENFAGGFAKALPGLRSVVEDAAMLTAAPFRLFADVQLPSYEGVNLLKGTTLDLPYNKFGGVLNNPGGVALPTTSNSTSTSTTTIYEIGDIIIEAKTIEEAENIEDIVLACLKKGKAAKRTRAR